MIGIVFGFWYGVQWMLNTEYPALAVASRSMLPTLNVGDLIIVQGTSPDQIYANYTTGDIIVFRSPNNPDELIVHRAVNKETESDGYLFTTKGDNNERPDPYKIHESNLVGRVVGRIPYVGNFSLLIHSRENMYLFTVIMIILIVILLTFPFESDKEEKTSEQKQKKRKLLGKLDFKIIYLAVLNTLIIYIIVFSLLGAFTFWQPGATGPQYVTIRGMFPDVQFHESFKIPYNNVRYTFLSQGFLTYKIDCLVDGTIRPGVATFSWAQAAAILIVVLDVWELVKFLRPRKKAETKTKT